MPLRDCPSQTDLVSQLQEWFLTWSDRPPGAEEFRLFWELIHEGDPELVNRLKPTDIQQWVRTWNKRLILSMGNEIPRHRVLCAFTCTKDTVYRFDKTELNAFVVWAEREMGMSLQNFVNKAATRALSDENGAEKPPKEDTNPEGGSPSGGTKDRTEHTKSPTEECHDLIDVLAALLSAWQEGQSGLRPALMKDNLRQQLNVYVSQQEKIRPERMLTLLGGASGNMASVLSKLGVCVTVHWPYHAPDIAAMSEGLDRLAFDDGRFSVQEASDPIKDSNHPLRRSIIFNYEPGISLEPAPTIDPNLKKFTSQKTDRQIFRYQNDTLAGGRPWKNIVLQGKDGHRILVEDPENKILHGDGWPFFPMFSWWRIEGDDLVFIPAADTLMEEVAHEYDYVLLSGLQALKHPLLTVLDQTEEDVNQEAREFIESTLRHQLNLLEGKGVRLHLEISGNTQLETLKPLKGMIKSAGLNQQELEEITKRLSFGHLRPFAARYERACYLAKELELDEIYIHGNDADLVLTRGAQRGAIWQAIVADLFTKGIVVLALLERSASSEWKSIARELSILLGKEGLLALMQIAAHLSKSNTSKPREERDFKDIAFSGYWYNRNSQDYSVAVIPVMWPTLPIELSTVGAGDAVSAAYTVLGGK